MGHKLCREAKKIESDQRAKARAARKAEAREAIDKARLDADGQPVVARPKADGVVVRLGLVAALFLISGCPKAEEMEEIKGADTGSTKAPAEADAKKKAEAKGEKTPSKPDEATKAPAEGTKK